MFEYRHTLAIVAFVSAHCALFFFALGTSERSVLGRWPFSRKSVNLPAEKFQISRFEGAKYYLLKGERPNFHLLADSLSTSLNGQRIRFAQPRGHFFTGDGRAINYRAAFGQLMQRDQFFDLEGEVALNAEDFQISAERLKYHLDEHRIEAVGEVDGRNLYWRGRDRIFLKGERATFWPREKRAQYSGRVLGRIERPLAYQSNIKFGSQELKFDRMEEKISAQGHLWIQKRGVYARGRRGDIYLAKGEDGPEEKEGEKFKYFVLYDDVRVEETVRTPTRNFKRQAFCEQLEGGLDGRAIVLTGNPRVVQTGGQGQGTIKEDSVIRGKQITLRENNEVVEIDDADTRFEMGP